MLTYKSKDDGSARSRRLRIEGTHANEHRQRTATRSWSPGPPACWGVIWPSGWSPRGDRVRALVRPGSRTDFLDALGVEIVRGDLTDPAALPGGRRRRRTRVSLRGQGRRLGPVAASFKPGASTPPAHSPRPPPARAIDRFIHISSTSAYGHPADGQAPIDESAPLGQNVWVLDYYTRSKVDCERSLWEMAEAGLPLTVIRPSWLFGERDRTTVPRLVREFRRGRMMIVGKGDNPLSAVYAGVVADAAILAAHDPGSRGEAYNITSHGRITQREFLDMFADALEVPRVTRQVPYALAFAGGFLLEMQDRLLMQVTAPARDAVWSLVARPLSGIQHRESPRPVGLATSVGYRESIERTSGGSRTRRQKPLPASSRTR